jgi:hypothetical protein
MESIGSAFLNPLLQYVKVLVRPTTYSETVYSSVYLRLLVLVSEGLLDYAVEEIMPATSFLFGGAVRCLSECRAQVLCFILP